MVPAIQRLTNELMIQTQMSEKGIQVLEGHWLMFWLFK